MTTKVISGYTVASETSHILQRGGGFICGASGRSKPPPLTRAVEELGLSSPSPAGSTGTEGPMTITAGFSTRRSALEAARSARVQRTPGWRRVAACWMQATR
jgi:hypothetical protein